MWRGRCGGPKLATSTSETTMCARPAGTMARRDRIFGGCDGCIGVLPPQAPPRQAPLRGKSETAVPRETPARRAPAGAAPALGTRSGRGRGSGTSLAQVGPCWGRISLSGRGATGAPALRLRCASLRPSPAEGGAHLRQPSTLQRARFKLRSREGKGGLPGVAATSRALCGARAHTPPRAMAPHTLPGSRPSRVLPRSQLWAQSCARPRATTAMQSGGARLSAAVGASGRRGLASTSSCEPRGSLRA